MSVYIPFYIIMSIVEQNDILINIGKKIREVRMELGFSIKQLAEKVGISYLTMQRIETDKLSPSVVLLAQISACLNYPVIQLLSEPKHDIVHIKSEHQNTIDTRKLTLKTIVTRGALDEDISIVHGMARKGKFVSRHSHDGFELAYILKGKAIYKGERGIRELKEGDLIFWDASQWHEVIALEPHEWLGIQFYSKRPGVGGTQNKPLQNNSDKTGGQLHES
jgi:transcriptional regulator with XRE-family HTH domain